MRIISGKHKGRKLFSPQDKAVRPTASKMREAVFNILISNGSLTDKSIVLDLCCGTGALGIEALSRGASLAIFIDGSDKHLRLARANIEQCNEQDKSIILRANAEDLPKAQYQCDLVFIDPPYFKGVVNKALISLINENWLADKAVIAIELAKREDVTVPLEYFSILATRIYGNSKFILLEKL